MKTRNRLNTDTIQRCIFKSQEIKLKSDICVDFVPTNNILKLMNKDNLYTKLSNDEFRFDSD